VSLAFFDTRTRGKVPFVPIEKGHVRVYTCGPTVYAPQHLGNMRPNLFADLLKRALLAEGLRVTHVINVTDVGHLASASDAGEDKMERAASRAGKTAAEIAAFYTAQWLHDRRRLRCLDPEVLCKATEHIPEQIELARVLEAKGHTYRIEDGLYFDVSTFSTYADFARLDLAGQEGGARIADVEGKRNPQDFALWKLAAPGVTRQQEWDSPWGRGFPGWHLECSAMSVHYLGPHFDLHTGGVDHIPVHHTNEIAQSECAYGVHPWVNVWMHNEFLDLGGEKLSKSKGHTLVLDDLVERGVEPLAYRYFFLQAHYRQQQSFSFEEIEASATGYRRLVRAAAAVRDAAGDVPASERGEVATLRARFWDAVRDDLNAPRALAVAWEVARSALAPPSQRTLLRDFERWLGLGLDTELPREGRHESDPRIDALVAARQAARATRDFARADAIRRELADEGIEIEDTKEGPQWRRVR
jgi:cysteinyl-tRNA synthetase